MTQSRRGPPLVLYVGGDDDGARSCAKAASPVPVVRSKHLRLAADRVRSMRPLLVVVGADVTLDEIEALRAVAKEQHASIMRLEEMPRTRRAGS